MPLAGLLPANSPGMHLVQSTYPPQLSGNSVNPLHAVLSGPILDQILKNDPSFRGPVFGLRNPSFFCIKPPGAPAFEFAGARSFVVFEGAGFRFMEAPALPAKKTKNVGKRSDFVKF